MSTPSFTHLSSNSSTYSPLQEADSTQPDAAAQTPSGRLSSDLSDLRTRRAA